jgi:uncharacterized protein
MRLTHMASFAVVATAGRWFLRDDKIRVVKTASCNAETRMWKRSRIIVKWLAIAAIAGDVGVAAVLYVKQRDFLYLPQSTRTSPAAAGFHSAEELVLRAADGERLIAWHVPPREDRLIVIFFHGNGDVLASRVQRFRDIISDGTGLLALSYRGYGGSSGFPTEPGLLRDAAAAYEFAAAKYAPQRIVVWGFSLGTGPAVALASRRQIRKLILEAPYTSVVDVAASVLPLLPIRLLLKDQFRSDEQVGRVTAPLLVMHGERDPGISIRFGERLFALANEPKRLVRFANGGHDDLDAHGAMAVAREFLYGSGVSSGVQNSSR